jgi:hypothetical protein
MSRNWFRETLQRQREEGRGQYYSTLDVLDNLGSIDSSINRFRAEVMASYDRDMPQLLAALGQYVEIAGLQLDTLVEIRGDLHNIDRSINALRASVEHGFEAVAYMISATNGLLQTVVDVLSNPVRTQAEEYARRGVEALSQSRCCQNQGDSNPMRQAGWYLER